MLEIPVQERMDLLRFRLELSEALVSCQSSTPEKPKKRGRPSNASKLHQMLQGEPSKKRPACEVRPSACVQYDSVCRLPEFDDKKEEAKRCKNCTTNRTHIYCVKFQVHLCFVKGRNCFSTFHDQ